MEALDSFQCALLDRYLLVGMKNFVIILLFAVFNSVHQINVDHL